MDINIDRTLLAKSSFDEDKLLVQLSSGNAVLFTGAGFSLNSQNLNGSSPRKAAELSKAICRLGGFEEDEDLRYTADFYVSKSTSLHGLIDFLKKEYTLKAVSNSQTSICSVNWRRCYTTNYDKSIEIGSSNNNKVVECVDVDDKPNEKYSSGKSVCVHINGSIDDLTEESIENTFKLTSSSYVSPDVFVKSPWHFYFKQDLERCSAIVFVGYSLYDIQIQKILYEGMDVFKDKTYFITNESVDSKTEYILSKYGHVVKIGVDGFARLIESKQSFFETQRDLAYLTGLCKYQILFDVPEVRDREIENILLFGQVSQSFVDKAINSKQSPQFLIVRKACQRIYELVVEKKNVIVYGELGNGKTLILDEAKSYLTSKSIDVYEIFDSEADLISDLDVIAQRGLPSVVIIDNYDLNMEFIQHYCQTKPRNITIVLSARTNAHAKTSTELNKNGFLANEINIDILNGDELREFIDIIDNLGKWDTKASWSTERKIQFLRDECKSQISLQLLEFFKSPQIVDRIKNSINQLLNDPVSKDTVFAIAFLGLLGVELEHAIISEVADNDGIYNNRLRVNEGFTDLFKLEKGKVILKSALFCKTLILNCFGADYVVNKLLQIANYFDRKQHDNERLKRIFRATLKYSFVESLLPDKGKKNSLERYYDRLKTEVPWLKYDPHFWLQYAMSQIGLKDYSKAQDYLNTAYAVATKKSGYDCGPIDNQQAHLHLKMANIKSNGVEVFGYFESAHRLLRKADDDHYKYKRVAEYKEFYDTNFSKLSKEQKQKFQRYCTDFLEVISGLGVINSVFDGGGHIELARNNLEAILGRF